MQRRKFLGIVTLGAGATTLPMWLSTAFKPGRDADDCDVPYDLSDLSPEFSDPDACIAGPAPVAKPRLVFVIPIDIQAQYQRGHAFGELLNAGSDAALAPLACFDVVCRRLADLGLVAGEHEPLLALLEAGQPPRLLDVPLNFDPDDPGDDIAVETRIDARIAALAGLIAHIADGPRLVAQACSERRSLAPTELQRLDDLPHSLGELQPHDVDRAPATALLAARDPDPEQRQHLTALLAASVRARLCARRIDGAPWAVAHGCGVEVEGEPDNSGGIMCGMGRIARRSARFLKFYSQQ
jgi:hypothetical protein